MGETEGKERMTFGDETERADLHLAIHQLDEAARHARAVEDHWVLRHQIMEVAENDCLVCLTRVADALGYKLVKKEGE